VKNEVMFESEKPLRANVARLIDLPALTIATIQRDRKTIEVRAAGDLAENQVGARQIGNHESGSALSAIGSRKWNDNDFAGYRFDHAASSSGELQSRPRTDSLSSAPLNGSSTSLSITSGVSMARYYANPVPVARNQFRFERIRFLLRRIFR
jgi:hypothetical protein